MHSILLCALSATSPAPAGESGPERALDERLAEVEGYRDTVERILRESVARGRAFELLVELVTAAPHRLSGSPGAAAAVEWGRQAMERLGLENVRLEPCTVPHWVRGEVESLEVVAPVELAGAQLPILALGGSVGTGEHGLTAEVIEVGNLDEMSEHREDARGRIVFFDHPMDPTNLDAFDAYGKAVRHRTRGAIAAAKAGGVATIVRSMTTRLDDYPHTGAMHYEAGVPRIPAAAISTLGAERLSAMLAEGHAVTLRLRMDCETLPDERSFNVVGEWPGRTSPEEIVLVGGHLDCWDVGQGAHDDGAGCCHALAAVRLLMDLGLHPRRTIRVVLFMNEENGLGGANAYRDAHLDELGRHVMALESDAGGFTPRGFSSNANEEAMEILRSIADLMEIAGADRVRDGGGGADIGPLAPHGVVLVGYRPDSQRYFDNHHSWRDTIDEVSPRELNLGMGTIAAMIYVVADLTEPLPRNR